MASTAAVTPSILALLIDVANAEKVVPDNVTVASFITIVFPSTSVPEVAVPSIVGQLVCQEVEPTCTQLPSSFL